MKRRIRKRRILKWVGLLACLGVGAAWFAATLFHSYYDGQGFAMGCRHGALEVYPNTYFMSGGWNLQQTNCKMYTWWPHVSFANSEWEITCPLWIVFGFCAIVTLLLFRLDRFPSALGALGELEVDGFAAAVEPEEGGAA
ncbi:MAG: hypothetical protein KDA54_05430 [Phycisphaerales bacterium]|nr:hypothetical protein [Phycisphaerales bacterium]